MRSPGKASPKVTLRKDSKEVGKLAFWNSGGRTFQQSETPLPKHAGEGWLSRGSEKASTAGIK